MRFFDIPTSKGGPQPLILNALELQMWSEPPLPALFRHLNVQKRPETFRFLRFWLAPYVAYFFWSLIYFFFGLLFFDPKVVRGRHFLTLLTCECAPHCNAVHFFDISTSKSGLTVSFNTLDVQMSFAPQQHALFEFSTSKSGPRPSVVNLFGFSDISTSKKVVGDSPFCIFCLRMYFTHLHATRARILSTSQRPKMAWDVQKWSDHKVLLPF